MFLRQGQRAEPPAAVGSGVHRLRGGRAAGPGGRGQHRARTLGGTLNQSQGGIHICGAMRIGSGATGEALPPVPGGCCGGRGLGGAYTNTIVWSVHSSNMTAVLRVADIFNNQNFICQRRGASRQPVAWPECLIVLPCHSDSFPSPVPALQEHQPRSLAPIDCQAGIPVEKSWPSKESRCPDHRSIRELLSVSVAQSNRSSVRWRTSECGRTRVPEFERIAHNKRRAIIGLDDVQAGIIKNSCNWSKER